MSVRRAAQGIRRRILAIVLGVPVVLLVLALSATGVVAQDPTATQPVAAATAAPVSAAATFAAPIDTGDPRSDGQGPGIVGEPLFVLIGIVLIGAVTVVVTAVYARSTGRA